MSNNTYNEKRFDKNPSVVSRKIAGEFILVPLRQKTSDVESIYTMNEVAGRIWEIIDGVKRFEDIRDVIVEEFEVNPEEAETDLVAFLTQLQKAGAMKEV